jgi:hypothetical protein
MSAPLLTVGGLAVGLAITGVNLWHWWKSPGRDPKNLAPFGGAFVLGGLSTLCGGLLGTLGGWTAGANNAAGRHAVTSVAGGRAGTVAHKAAGTLTPGGALATTLIAVGVFVTWRAASKQLKRKLAGGWWAGATLTLSAGMAGLFVHVVTLVNSVGGGVLGWFNGVPAA